MIKVTIELMSAITGRTSEIGRMYIANDGGGTADRGSYDVAVCRRNTTAIPRELFKTFESTTPKATRTGRVENYPRQAYNVWRLIARAVLSAFPEEASRVRHQSPTDGEGREILLARIDALEEECGELTRQLIDANARAK